MTSRTLCAVDSALRAGAAAGPVMGIETGGPRADLALIDAGRVMAEASHPVLSHGAELPEAAGRLLASAGLALNELRAIAIGIGPGSFTGLRVGLSYAKGLAIGARIQLVGIPSLDALALCGSDSATARPGMTICPILDARKGEVYVSLYA